MRGGNQTNRRMNVFNVVASLGVFATGLIMLMEFHVGHGSEREMFMGVGKSMWMTMHRGMAISFLCGYIIHIELHWRYITNIAKPWRTGLSKKVKTKSKQQGLLVCASFVVMGTGFCAWVVFPGATLAQEEFHHWIDVHNITGLLLLAVLGVHIKRRWRRMFGLRRAGQ